MALPCPALQAHGVHRDSQTRKGQESATKTVEHDCLREQVERVKRGRARSLFTIDNIDIKELDVLVLLNLLFLQLLKVVRHGS